MKILVLEPPAVSKYGNQRIYGGNGGNKSDFRKAPVDVMWISGYLRTHGFDNTFYDANNSRETIHDVENLLRELRPDVIFISTSTCTIYKDMEVATVTKRDVKGLYKKALTGESENFTGISDPYEEPENPDWHRDSPILPRPQLDSNRTYQRSADTKTKFYRTIRHFGFCR